MEVILCQDVQQLGKIGDVIKVKDGYARNFLIPKELAYIATPENLKRIEKQKKKKATQEEKIKKEAEGLAAKLNKVSCTVSVEVNDLEKLYGAVTETDIIKALELEGYTFTTKSIVIDKPIDELGIYEVGIKLHPKVIAKIRLWVTKK